MRARVWRSVPRGLSALLMIGLTGSVSVLFRLPLPVSGERVLFFLNLALPFAGVGSLAWVVGSPRPAARLLGLHCLAVVLVLVVLPSTLPLMVCLGILARVGALLLLLRFLRTLAAEYHVRLAHEAPQHDQCWRWYRMLVACLGGCCACAALLSLTFVALLPIVSGLFFGFLVLVLAGGFLWCLSVSHQSALPLEREQMRLAAAALVELAVVFGSAQMLPWLLHHSQASAWVLLLSLPAFPITLGYALLRPHVVVLDRRIFQIALWLGRMILCSLLIAFIDSLLVEETTLRTPGVLVIVAVSLTSLGPLLWWGTRAAFQRLFAQEMTALRAFLAAPPAVSSLEEAALVLTGALSLASRSSQVCVCLCEEDQRMCLPVPTAAFTAPTSLQRQLFTRACACWDLPVSNQPWVVLPEAVWNDLRVHRWIPLHRWHASSAGQRWRWWQHAPAHSRQEMLALPLREETGSQVQGLVLLGAAEDGQPYTGADLERLMQVLEKATPWLAHQRHLEETRRQDRLLGQMYSGLAFQDDQGEPEALIRHYAEQIVSWGASVEAFWCGQQERLWLHAGDGPWLTAEERQSLLHPEPVSPSFCSSGSGSWSCAVVVLPFRWAMTTLVLLVTFPHPLVFLPREQAYWHILVHHCQQRLNEVHRRARQRTTAQEQATLLTVLTGNLDLLAEEQNPAKAALAVRQATLAAQQLFEGAEPSP